jgi:hypothetical protein
MTVSTCPSCHESVTVPVEAQPDSIVRCPLCQEEFQLTEFLSQLPPPLIVLSPTGEPLSDGTGLKAEKEEGRSSLFPQMAAPTAEDNVPAFDFVPGSASTEENSGVDTSFAPLRRQKNPTIEIAKIVAGGLLALPLAQLILWWLPGEWQRDPLQIGPDVGRVLPWVVPANFRPGEAADSSTAAADRTSIAPDDSSKSRSPRNSTNGQKSAAESQTKAPAGRRPKAGNATAKKQAKNGAGNGTNSPPTTIDPPSPNGRVVLGVKNAPKYSTDQLHQTLEQAIQANVAWDFSVDVTEEAMATTTDQFYAAFAQLGHAITFADTSSGDVRSYVSTLLNLLTAFGEQPKKLAMIGNRGAQWLRETNRTNQGALLFGTVKQIRYRGLLYETTLDLAARGDDRTVMVVSTRDPKTAFALKSRVLILGAIVTDPKNNMVGYQGDEPFVVVAGFPVPLPE